MNEIFNKIKEYEIIRIYRHIYPDPDAYGASIGIKEIIKTLYKDKKVYLMGEDEDRLSYLGKMDNIKPEENEKFLSIVLDVSNKERIDDSTYMRGECIIKIDHHKVFKDKFEDITWVDTNYPSCSEMILDLAIFKEIDLNLKGRYALYAGIIGDTGRFLYVENPANLFLKVSKIAYDFNTKEIYRELYKRNTEELRFLGHIYNKMEETKNGVLYVKIKNKDLLNYNLEPIKAARMVNALSDCEGIKNWMIFVEKENGEIFAEFRSNGPRVNDIAAKYGGGGHKLASGATLKSFEEVDKIIKEFDMNCS